MEQSGRVYVGKAEGISADVFKFVQSDKCTADTNKRHVQEFIVKQFAIQRQ